MKLSDFQIGTIFYTCTGQVWRCTDVGTRTILAIELKADRDQNWYNGPPYAVDEVPFDEHDIRAAYRSEEDAIQEAMDNCSTSAHPGYSGEAVNIMMKGRFTSDHLSYPNEKLFEIDRVSAEGEVLHPYSVQRQGDSWRVLVYVPFTEEFNSLPEEEFINLRHATEADYVRRRDQKRK